MLYLTHAQTQTHIRPYCVDVNYDLNYFEQLLVGLVSSFRYGGSEINARLAQSEADILHEAIKDKNQNNEEIIRILTTRSKIQLVATFNRYRDDHGIAITKVHN